MTAPHCGRTPCAMCFEPLPAEAMCIHGRWLCFGCCQAHCWEDAA